MRPNFKSALAGVFLPVAFFTIYSPDSIAQTSRVAITSVSRPYLLEVISPEGIAISEVSGTSSAVDPVFIIQDLGVDVYDKDKIKAFPDPVVGIGGKIVLSQTPGYEIIDGKKKIKTRSWARTVGELLEEEGIILGADDKINFAPDSILSNGMLILIIRVERTTVTEHEAIDYKTTKKNDPTLDQGKTKVEQKGIKGQRRLIYEVVREGGVEVSRVLQNIEVVREPVEEKILVGTKPVITTACRYNSLVLVAATKNGVDANALCYRMMKESNGNPNAVGAGVYKGLFQYEEGFWNKASNKAGYAGASIWDPKAQIEVTAWAWANGYRGRWPSP